LMLYTPRTFHAVGIDCLPRLSPSLPGQLRRWPE
jgi:hypothetical protein